MGSTVDAANKVTFLIGLLKIIVVMFHLPNSAWEIHCLKFYVWFVFSRVLMEPQVPRNPQLYLSLVSFIMYLIRLCSQHCPHDPWDVSLSQDLLEEVKCTSSEFSPCICWNRWSWKWERYTVCLHRWALWLHASECWRPS